MITPIMLDRIGWGTYLFFACVNACFLPFIWIFYPETRRRSLEEIDIIFAKGYLEKNYIRAAKELPYLSDEEIEQKAYEYGLVDQVTDEATRKSIQGDGSSDDLERAPRVVVGEDKAGLGAGIKDD